MSEAADRIIESWDKEPKNWLRRDYSIDLKGSGLQVSRGLMFLGWGIKRPMESTFGLIDGWRLWWAYRRLSASLAVIELDGGDAG